MIKQSIATFGIGAILQVPCRCQVWLARFLMVFGLLAASSLPSIRSYAQGQPPNDVTIEEGKHPGSRMGTKSVEEFKKGCNGGDNEDCATLGLMYEDGLGVQQDRVKAAAIYRKACWRGSPKCCFNLGEIYEKQDPLKAAKLYRKACKAHEGHACNNLGMMFEYGEGMTIDRSQAIVLYRESCDLNTESGCNNLGVIYKRAGLYAEAARFYHKACDLDRSSPGCRNLVNLPHHSPC